MEQESPHTKTGFTDHLTALHDSITEEFTLKIPDEGNPGVHRTATAMFCRGFTGTGRREAALHIPPGFTHGGCTFQVLLCPVLGQRGSLPAFLPSFTFRDHLEQPPPAVPGHVGFTLQEHPFPMACTHLTAGRGRTSLKHPRDGIPKRGTHSSPKYVLTAELT